MTMYDIAVIGKGLIGSAAARHLAGNFPELKICVIGPDEPENRKAHQGVFASHYDQGRITRVLDPSPLWGQLARESIAQYAVIEAASGIRFHHRVGCLRASDIPAHIQAIDDCAGRFQPPHRRLDAASCREAYPYLSFSDAFVAWDEGGEAGYINPRSLIAAQLKVAEENGAAVFRDIVTAIDHVGDCHEIHSREGEARRARKILLTAGGYSNTLLENKLRLRTKAHTILLAELAPAEVDRLKTMPSIISAFDHPLVDSLYVLPPVRYPDGKTYIKLGGSGWNEAFLDATENDLELLDWFHSDGGQDIADALKTALHTMIPDLKTLSYHSAPCLITNSAHGKPYVDVLQDRGVYVATAGNGAGAKSSDEIGRIGAMLCATDNWHSELDRNEFRAVYYEGGLK
ncbi:MAG: FAD-dependent oxidoreductase [Chloroflexota bacterium]|nr:FAD-dependent oxidoreductase [Chloroflexota bacterium]